MLYQLISEYIEKKKENVQLIWQNIKTRKF
jgi:hypothetical protein